MHRRRRLIHATGRVSALAATSCLLTFVALVGCKREADPPPPTAGSSEPARAPAASVPIPAAPATTRPDALPPTGLAGSWAGRYDAKKGTVTLPAKVKAPGFAADDGKSAVGPGSVDLEVSPSGDVRGKVAGALGAGTITGKLDGTMLRAAVRPDDPYAPNAMTGVLIGEQKGEVLACDLHVAGPDGTVIREASVELKRKK